MALGRVSPSLAVRHKGASQFFGGSAITVRGIESDDPRSGLPLKTWGSQRTAQSRFIGIPTLARLSRVGTLRCGVRSLRNCPGCCDGSTIRGQGATPRGGSVGGLLRCQTAPVVMARRFNPPAADTSAGSKDPAGFGAKQAMKASFASKPSRATTGGTRSCLTPLSPTGQKNEMRPSRNMLEKFACGAPVYSVEDHPLAIRSGVGTVGRSPTVRSRNAAGLAATRSPR